MQLIKNKDSKSMKQLGNLDTKEMNKQVTTRAICLYFMEHFLVKGMSLRFEFLLCILAHSIFTISL